MPPQDCINKVEVPERLTKKERLLHSYMIRGRLDLGSITTVPLAFVGSTETVVLGV
jgi:hypothetical protein